MGIFDGFSGIIAPGTNPADPTDPQTIARKRLLAEALIKQGTDYSPIRSPWQGAARVSQALLGAYDERNLDQQEKANFDYSNKAGSVVDSILGGGSVGSATPSSVPAVLTGGGGAVPPETLAPLIQKASAATGIPVPVLTAQIKQESNFNPNAVGKAGEVGLMQILPSTAKDPGFGMQGVDPAALRDPETNIMFGANYLKARGGKVDYNNPSNVAKALTAYNGGGDPNYAQNVSRFMPGQGGQPMQVAQNGPPQGMMGLGQAGGPAQPAQDTRIQQMQLLKIIGDPYTNAATKAKAQAALGIITKDPNAEVDRALKLSQIQENQLKIRDWGQTEAGKKLTELGISRERAQAALANPKDPLFPTINALYGSGVNVTTNLGGQDAEAKAAGEKVGGALGDRQVSVENAYQTVPEKLQKVQLFRTLLNGVNTGAMAGTEGKIADLALGLGIQPDTLKSLGIDPSLPATQQSLQSAIASATVGMIGKGGFPANNFSDADRKFLLGTNVQLTNRPEANDVILKVQERTAQRELEAADSWRAAQKAGVSYKDWEQKWASTPKPDIFADLRPELDAIKAKGGPAGVAPPKAGEVRKGYQYMGGDPGNPASWRKVPQT